MVEIDNINKALDRAQMYGPEAAVREVIAANLKEIEARHELLVNAIRIADAKLAIGNPHAAVAILQSALLKVSK